MDFDVPGAVPRLIIDPARTHSPNHAEGLAWVSTFENAGLEAGFAQPSRERRRVAHRPVELKDNPGGPPQLFIRRFRQDLELGTLAVNLQEVAGLR
jgi:hypothetical protein